uniref:Serine protease family S09X putative n=1 Tax=Albugo laibachii Nc14 TaxID=890382 RepID=F0WD74_9STRA|nr:serine protease family S09X putative [Albugo laibachii Nc14]|eukprot:CCA19146.1 serine protease family S09X putative [Albugo laibachii Nc14]
MGNSESRTSTDQQSTLTVPQSAAPCEDAGCLQRSSTLPSHYAAQNQANSDLIPTSVSVTDISRRGDHLHSHPLNERGGIQAGQQAMEDTTNKLGYWYLLKNGYNELVHLIIRPPRARYQIKDLGPTQFPFLGSLYERLDFQVLNSQNQALECSFWRAVERSEKPPCVIYLHGNSSCRVECLPILRTCLSSGLSVVAFDGAGSGKSQGEYISLGYYERDDLQAVIQHLRDNQWVSSIGLWGRSMGAATALLHVDRDPSIAGIIVDSAFTSLEELVQEIVEQGRQEGLSIPAWAFKLVMRCIRSSVQKRAYFDIRELAPKNHASQSFVPAMFVAARNDSFIGPHHSQDLHEVYAGDKNLVIVDGDHNTLRPSFLLDSAGIFLQNALHIDPSTVQANIPVPGARRCGRFPWSNSKSIWLEAHSQASRPGQLESERSASQRGSVARERLQGWRSEIVRSRRSIEFYGDAKQNLPFSDFSQSVIPQKTWNCSVCTFLNAPMMSKCDICQSRYRPEARGMAMVVDRKERVSRQARKYSL